MYINWGQLNAGLPYYTNDEALKMYLTRAYLMQMVIWIFNPLTLIHMMYEKSTQTWISKFSFEIASFEDKTYVDGGRL